MKTCRIAFLVIVLALVSLIITGCFSAYGSDEGTLTINLNGGGARAASMPYPPDDANGVLIDLVHHIQVQGPGGSQNRIIAGVTSTQFTLASGLWQITVNSYHESDHYATGTGSIGVKAGQQNSTVISMNHIHLWTPTGFPTVASTCTATGIGEVECSPCGKKEPSGIIPALGHASFAGLNCTVCLSPANIGDKGPGGGIIFYRNDTGFTMTDDSSISRYLEAAPAGWSGTPDDPQLRWVPSGSPQSITDNIIDTNDAIGAGRKNTALMLDGLGSANAPAADACNTYDSANKWFLPSRNELNELYKLHAATADYPGLTTGLSNSNYWSSCQAFASTGGYDNSATPPLDRRNQAYYQLFSTGGQIYAGKGLERYVRPIRAF